jgi:hypothetical protein
MKDPTKQAVQDLKASILRLENRLDRLEDKLDANFRWLMGTILITWATTIAAIIGVAFAVQP